MENYFALIEISSGRIIFSNNGNKLYHIYTLIDLSKYSDILINELSNSRMDN